MDQATLSILKELHEAVHRGKGGEVVLRSGEHTGRVFFASGRVALVVAPSLKRTLVTHLAEKTELTRGDLREVVEACKQTGDNFGETILEWGLLDEATLRALMLDHLGECLLEILCWPEPSAMFVPEDRPYKGRLTFDLEEVIAVTLKQDTEGRLPFKGASVLELLDAVDGVGEEDPAAAASAPEPTAATAPPPPAGPRPPWGGIVVAGVLLLVIGGLATWLLTRQSDTDVPPAPDKGADLALPDAARPDAPRPDVARPDSRAAPDSGGGIVVGRRGRGYGSVKVVSIPGGALIYLDGVHTGRRTPHLLKRIATGHEHVIQIERRGYRPTVKRFKLAPGMRAQLYLKLWRTRRRPKPGKVAVRLVTRPPGAEVWVNRKRTEQTTPATIELDLQRRSRVELRMKGFRRWRHLLKPPREPALTYEVKLRPRRVRQRRRPRRSR